MDIKSWLKKSDQDGFFYIGHASALARIAGKILLFDPLWNYKPYGEYWEFIPEQINCEEILEQVDTVFVSHIHSDHICPRILAKVKCPIVIMEGRPNLTKKILECNSNVITSQSRTWITSDLGFEFYFQPHAFNSIDSSVFVRSKDFCLYHGNDNFLDKKNLELLRQDIPKIDVALLPYAFIHWYPHLMSHVTESWRQSETKRLNQQSLDQAQDFIRTLQPKAVIPFGASLFFAEGANHILNQSLAGPHDVEGALSIIAGGWVMADGTHSQPITKEDYESLLADLPLDKIKEKVQKAPTINNHEIIVNNIVIDTEKLTVVYRDQKGSKPFTHFTFKPVEFRKWLKGEITFEEAIGTRQFTCHREPNEYNLKVFEFMNNFL